MNSSRDTMSARLHALADPVLALFLLWTAAGGALAAEVAFDLQIEHGRLRGGPQVIRVHQGHSVRLRWRTDRPAILHLHGYDIETRVEPGTVGELAFEAHATGRFPIHLHARNTGAGGHAQQDAPLAYIDVYPG